ncbi:MAG TPA: HD domain-containing protein, partial [Cystobacter sp.]
ELPRGADYLALWEEYEQGTSFEARLVRQVDRLEMGLQATVYEHQGAGDLSQFFASVHKVLETPELQALLAELETLRPARCRATSPRRKTSRSTPAAISNWCGSS